jgi:DNA polymerase-3 subunit delta'
MSQYLSKVLGQNKSISVLENFFLTNNLPHALLFSGQEGTGKFFTSLQFAKEVNSEFITNQFIKNKFNQLEEPYIKYIFPLSNPKIESLLLEPNIKLTKDDKAIWENFQSELDKKKLNPYYNISLTSTSSIRIGQIRDINKFLAFDFTEIPHRVIIIEHADLMTEQAQNSLLKNLEEPPEGILFILISSNTEKLLPTIKSRCQEIKFEPLKINFTEKILKEYFNIHSIDHNVLRLADGSVTKALQLLEFDLNSLKELVLNILRFSLIGKYQKSLEYFEEASANYQKLLITFSLILLWFSDCQKLKNRFEKDIYFVEYLDKLKNFIEKFPNASYLNIEKKISSINSMLDKNINLTLILLDIIFEIRQIGKK